MNITVCRFKRWEINDAWEEGVMIDHEKAIIDTDGKLVAPVWNYELMFDRGCVDFTLGQTGQ